MKLHYDRVTISLKKSEKLTNKQPIPGMSYFFWNYWPWRSQRTPNIAGYFQYYWLPSEFDSAKKHNRVLEPGQISPERKELKALSYYLASIALEGATQTTREKITHQS